MGVTISTASPLPDDVSIQSYNGSWRIKNKVLLETLTPSAVGTITSSALSAYDFYIIEGSVVGNGIEQIYLRINGLTTNIYNDAFITDTTISNSVNQAKAFITYVDTNPNLLKILITGKANAAGYICSRNDSVYAGGIKAGVGMYINAGANTQISTLNLYCATKTFTGTIKIYGVTIGGF